MILDVSTAPRVSLRAVTEDDRDFLVRLYASTRDDLAPLPEEQRSFLVEMQFNAQDRQYRHAYPDASFDVIDLDGRPVGRLYVDRRTDDLRIVDISLLPEHRGAGIGAALVRVVQDEAAASGRGVSLHVALGNRAAALYERLGFRLVADRGANQLLEWRAS